MFFFVNMKSGIMVTLIFTISILLFGYCSSYGEDNRRKNILEKNLTNTLQETTSLIDTGGMTIQTRFLPPAGFFREDTRENSFETFLRNLPLKPHDAEVHYFDGSVKPAGQIYWAVVDLDLGTRNLQQCADAIIRLRAEFLFVQNRHEEIHFNFTNGVRADYLEFARGCRPVFSDNEVKWEMNAPADYTYKNFRNYLDMVFVYAGSYSLSQELHPVKDINDIRIGDVFIRGGFPGHAVLIVDLVTRHTTGDKLFLLAQSYMPAQDIQVLRNPQKKRTDPWYKMNTTDKLITPEWIFRNTELKRFSGDEN